MNRKLLLVFVPSFFSCLLLTAWSKPILAGSESSIAALLEVSVEHEATTARAVQDKAKLSSELIIAAGVGDAARVEELLAQGADVNARDRDGRTALWWAAGSWGPWAPPRSERPVDSDIFTVARLLLAHGASTEIKDGSEYNPYATPLMRAIGNLPMLDLLLNNGAEVDARNNAGETALMLAVWRNVRGISTVRLLLEHGANPNARDNSGKTPIIKTVTSVANHPSWSSPYPPILRALLTAGGDINAADERGVTALMYAARPGGKKDIQLLLDSGADINLQDEQGMTALMRACLPFHLPAMSSSGSDTLAPNPAVVRLLLTRGADPDIRDKDGATALIWIAKFRFWEYLDAPTPEYRKGEMLYQKEVVEDSVRIMLAHGANVNSRTKNGNTALKWAQVYNNTSLIRLLRDAGAEE